MAMKLEPEEKEGALSVWWIPQIPGFAFRVGVDSVDEGKDLCRVLAAYDQFQFEQNIKPDYSNMGGISRWERDGDGEFDWCDVEEDEDV